MTEDEKRLAASLVLVMYESGDSMGKVVLTIQDQFGAEEAQPYKDLIRLDANREQINAVYDRLHDVIMKEFT